MTEADIYDYLDFDVSLIQKSQIIKTFSMHVCNETDFEWFSYETTERLSKFE